jgi:hypothetical protein
MADGSESIDFWDVLDEAEQTVERWPSWQQEYDGDVYYEDDPATSRAIAIITPRPAVMVMRHYHSVPPS